MDTEDQTSGRITIPLNNRRPISIVAADWPIVTSYANTDRKDDPDEPWTHERIITVRRHKDGVAHVVYGSRRSVYGGEFANTEAGELVLEPEDHNQDFVAIAVSNVLDKLKLFSERPEALKALFQLVCSQLPPQVLDDVGAAIEAHAAPDAEQEVA